MSDTRIEWAADFVCKTCGWSWFASGKTPEQCFAQFDHTCIGPPSKPAEPPLRGGAG